MTTVVVPCAVDATGVLRQTRVVIELVSRTPDRRWELAQGLRTIGGAPVAASFVFGIAPDDPNPVLKVPLYPQSEIASQIPTWYRFGISIPFDRESVAETYYVQVPDADNELLLSTLIGAAAIPPGSLPATIVADTLDAAVAAQAAKDLADLDAIATAADRAQTTLDAAATASDRVQTGLDAIATSADRVQTGIDAAATAADRVQTGIDAASAADSAATVGAALSAHVDESDPHAQYRLETDAIALADLAQDGATLGQVVKWSGVAWTPADDGGGGGGSGSTNLSVVNRTATSLDVASDTGSDATIPAADGSLAGLMPAAAYSKLAGIDTGATAAGAAGDAFATAHLVAFAHALIATALQPDALAGGAITPAVGALDLRYVPSSALGSAAYTAATAYDPAGSAAAITLAGLGGVPLARTVTAGSGLSGGGELSGNITLSVSFGSSAGTVCQGNDARLSDARTPTAHTHPASDLSDSTAAGRALVTATDAAAQRTSLGLGTAATHADSDYATAGQGTLAASAIQGSTGATANALVSADGAGGKTVKATGVIVGASNELSGFTEKLYSITTSGNVTLDLANGPFQRFVLDAARQFTMPASPGAVAATLTLLIDCNGFTPTWNSTPTIVHLTDDGNAPALNTIAGKRNLLIATWDYATTSWLLMLARAQA